VIGEVSRRSGCCWEITPPQHPYLNNNNNNNKLLKKLVYLFFLICFNFFDFIFF
jgi:hypothetical protein